MHELRVYARFFRAIRNGRKTWEFRREDGKPFHVGETLILNEVGDMSRKPTGRRLRARVTYVCRRWPIPEGWVCMSIKPEEGKCVESSC